jgi:CopG antitoxin of type II toxin-antitoxin system
MEKSMTTAKIPQTDSITELAQFWDTHDLTDFTDQLEEVPEPVFTRKPATMLTIRLQPDEAEALERLATATGVEQAALIQEWVREKLRAS